MPASLRPKERVLTAFARQEPDRVPLNYSGNPGITSRLLKHFGLADGDHEGLLQPEAKDMSPEYLKRTFGERLAFHGCISTAGPLAYGTVDDVTQTVRETLEIMMPGALGAHSVMFRSPVRQSRTS